MNRPPCLRVFALSLALACAWSFAGAGVALAAAPAPKTLKVKRPALRMLHDSYPPPAFRAPAPAPTAGAPATRFASPTLLDEVGHLARPVDAAQVSGWKQELRSSRPASARAATLHLWLGEWELAQNEQPETALRHFHEARARLAHADRLYGLVSYDTAVALFKEGAYADSEDAFSRLLAPKAAQHGYSRKNCALWLRHAAVCAGYHAERSAQNIPEPPRLDPLCGAAALAASLRALGRPSDKKTLLAACRVTGEGSSLSDIRDAGRKLGVSVDALTADDQGLIALPMPLVAHVEHDHFVALIRADKRGVSYLCSDCGPWPGGRVDLTWKQWHLLEPDVYCAVSIKNSPWNQAVTALPTTPHGIVPAGVQVASVGRLPRLGRSLEVALHLSRLGKHVLRYDWGGYLPECTVRWDALKCADCLECCLEDAPGGSGPLSAHGGAGPSGGDPVNLATGEEEYRPAPDLTVYNPVGPSVQWTRLYDSLRGDNRLAYETEDYGIGWSQGYNVGVINRDSIATTANPLLQIGQAQEVIQYDGLTQLTTATSNFWVISDSSNTAVASNNPSYGTQNGWNMTDTVSANGSHQFSVSVSASAKGGNNFTWNYYNAVNNGHAQLNIGSFDVLPSGPTAGTKSLFLANGGRVTFNAPGVPTSASPHMACTPQAGAPFLAEWDYDNGSTWGHFVITWKDRTRWITTTGGGQSQYILYQVVDRNSKAVTFNYTSPITVAGNQGRNSVPVYYAYDNFPLLASITNIAGTTLLSISRNSTGGVTSVSDCYGRSVAYQSGALGPSFIPAASLTHVSQIVPTPSLGSSTLPDKYAYGYQSYTDDQNHSEPVLHTITAPSPSGPAPSTASLTVNETGTSTATINYTNGGAGFVSSLVDGNGNTRTYTNCDASGNTTSTQGNYTKVTVTDKNNNVVYSYIGGVDMYMSGKSVTDGNGHALMSKTFSDSHDPYRPSSVTDGNGNTTQMTWDPYANMTSVTPPASAVRTPAATTSIYSYTNFGLGELTQVQTGSKSPTTYAYYEPSGLPQTITVPLPGTVGSTSTAVTSFTYDGLGNPLTITKPGNNTASSITTTMGYTTDGTYSQPVAIGQPLTVTNNLGKVTHLRYDLQGNVTNVIDALGNYSAYMTYTIANAPIATSLPCTGQTGGDRSRIENAYLYAEPASLATTQWPAQTLQYGPLYTVTRYGERLEPLRQTASAYGQEGELLSVSGSTEPVSYTYDALYRQATLKDAAGNTTSYFYNPAGYLAQVVCPGAQATPPTAPLAAGTKDTTSFTSYDGKGDMLSRVDGNNVTTTYAYNDPESRLTDVTYPSGTIGNIHYAYDSYGRRQSMTDGTGGQTYAYDDDDALTQKNVTWTGFTAKTISYGFYPNGSRQSMNAGGRSFAYSYDAVGRMSSLTNDNSETTRYSYQDNGWLAAKTLGNGVVTTYTRDGQGRLRDLVNKTSAGGVLSDFAVPPQGGYDGVGNRLSVTATVNGGAPASYSGTTSYAYDYGQTTNPQMNRSQLTQETSTRASGTFSYGYDGGTAGGPGNPTLFKGTTNTFNANNQVTNTGYGYDGNGNPTTYKGSSLTFDPENRVAQIKYSAGNTYDGDGLRVRRDYLIIPGSREPQRPPVYYLYDGSQPVCEYIGFLGNTTLNTTDTFGADGLVSSLNLSSNPPATAFYAFDDRGNVSQRTTSTGAVTSTDAYDAYGICTSTGSADEWGFEAQAGYRAEYGTGLILCTHRFYDPSNGRWLTRDPMGYDGGVNLYGYCRNDPVNQDDPSGYWPPFSLPGGGTFGGVMSGGALLRGGTLVRAGVGLEATGAAADGTIFGAPIGVVLGIAGGVVLVAAGGVFLYNKYVDRSTIYRRGGSNPGNWKPGTGGRSCRSSLSNPWPQGDEGPVFRPGDDWVSLDTDLLPPGEVDFDDVPPGHVNVGDDVPIGEPGEEGTIKGAVNGKGKFPL